MESRTAAVRNRRLVHGAQSHKGGALQDEPNPSPSCDAIGFQEGDRFQFTVREKLPQSRESDGEAGVPLEVGDSFQLTAGRLRYDEYDGCMAPCNR